MYNDTKEYTKILAAAEEHFESGKPLFGKAVAFHQVLADFSKAAKGCEIESHHVMTKPVSGNRLMVDV
ncbi:hypothetical protein [Hallella colorans]|uniref:hypothetical protein n=1 Tax=Hallella colorans TaxID=1703337 RepID=UPI0023F19F01|nr:hypothetical protein [Hallella colorans]